MREQNICQWSACRANKGGECSIISKRVGIDGKIHEFDTLTCPFYMTEDEWKDDEKKKIARFKELGLDYLLKYSAYKAGEKE